MHARRLALGLWLLFLGGCILVVLRTQLRSDLGAFLPGSAAMAQQVLEQQVTRGAASHLIMLGIGNVPAPAAAALSAALAARMRRQEEFTDVINGDAASFAAAQDFVWRNRYLLSPDVTADRLTASGLHAALLNDLGLLGSDLAGMAEKSLPGDPTDEVMALLPAFGGGAGPASQDGVWLAADGLALLLVHTRAAGFDMDAQQLDVALIEADFAAAKHDLPQAQAAQLLLSGPGLFAIHTRDTTKRDVMRLSLLATAGAVGLLAFAYRSPRIIGLGILPVASGAIAAVAAVSLAFGYVHVITLGFGVTLIGESLDYAIYLFTQTGQAEAGRDTLSRIWPTLRLGVLTSVLGFGAMLFSNFVGFAQLGLFSITGLIVAAGVTRFVLPHLIPSGFFAAGAEPISMPLRRIIRHRRRLRFGVAAAVLAAGVALVWHRGGLWENDLAGLSPIPAADQALDSRLRHDLGVPDFRFFAVLRAPGEQPALLASEALDAALQNSVAAHQLAGFDVPSTLLPSNATQLRRQAALPDSATLQSRFAQAGAGLPFRPGIFGPFFRDVAAAKTGPLIDPAALPPEIALRRGAMLVQNGNGWVVMAPLHDVTDPASVARAIAAAGIAGAAFIDLDQQTGILMRSFQREAVTLAVTGSAAIVLLLLLGLRSLRRVATVAAPLAAAVLITAALLTANGGKISIFMVLGFLLIVAVGSNYCLFFERPAPDGPAWRRSIASVMLANLCTVSAYGLMAWSEIPVLHDIGETVAVGTFLSLVCAAVLNTPRIAGAEPANLS